MKNMNRNILSIVSVFATAGLVGINLSVTNTTNPMNELSMIKLNTAEAGDAEWGGWSNFWQGQGFWKDEHFVVQQCPIEESSSFEVCLEYTGTGGCLKWSESKKNPAGRTDIRCTNGSSNCSSIRC